MLYTLIFIYICTCIHQHIICVFIRTLYYAYSLVISIYICNIYNVSSSYLYQYHTIWWFLLVAVISTSWKIGQSCPFCGASLNHPKEFDWVSKFPRRKIASKNPSPKIWLWFSNPQSNDCWTGCYALRVLFVWPTEVLGLDLKRSVPSRCGFFHAPVRWKLRSCTHETVQTTGHPNQKNGIRREKILGGFRLSNL